MAEAFRTLLIGAHWMGLALTLGILYGEALTR